MDKQEVVKQTKLAFEFIQKLYLEVSYLIKEVEGLLAQAAEQFVIGKPSGYSITTRSSVGLEPGYVSLWPLRKLAVFFVPKELTQVKGGTTITRLDVAKVIYLRVILDDRELDEPLIYCGVLHSFEKLSPEERNWPTKFEHLMAHIEYNDAKVMPHPEEFEFEDVNVRFLGALLKNKLYDLDTSEQISEKVIRPALKMFRDIR